jgi:hypothetical protein
MTRDDGIRIGPLWFHRREQWDLGRHSSLMPLLCVHWSVPGQSSRIFCVWKWGVLLKKPWANRMGRHGSWIIERRIDGVIREAGL